MPGAFPLETELDVHLTRLTALVNLISTKAEPLPRAGALRVITAHRQEVEEAMAALGGWILDFEAARPALEAAQAARQKLTAPLHAWAQTGPAHSRSIAVPPGGASYELAEVLQRQIVAGADVPALIFDDYLRNAPLTQVYITHLNLFPRRLREEVAACARNARVVRVLALLYNGGYEIAHLVENATLAGRVQLTLVDRSSEALRDAQQKLSRLLGQRIECERREPLLYVVNPLASGEAFHIVYSVSSFSSTKTGQVITMLYGIHRLLRPGGVLLAGNVAPSAPAREMALRRWWLGWELQPRDEAAWQAIAARTPFGSEGLRCIAEPGGMGLIVRGEKAE